MSTTPPTPKPTPATLPRAKELVRKIIAEKLSNVLRHRMAVGSIILRDDGRFTCKCETVFGDVCICGTGKICFAWSIENHLIGYVLI